jgi:spermidine synthase
MFAATLGHEFPAVIAVVSAFMAGMGLGAFVFQRFRPGLNWYARLEIAIGLWAVATLFLIPAGNALARRLVGIDAPIILHWTVSFSIVFFSLLPATAALGATFPAMTRLAADAKKVPLIYGLNTAGAVIGALAMAYALMPQFGLRNSLIACAATSILCGLVGWRFSSPPQESSKLQKASLERRFWVTVFFTGLLGLGYEMAGIRIMSHVVENTVFTFACVLAVYLIGTALGAFLIHRLKSADPRKTVNKLLLFLGVTILVSGFLGGVVDRCYDSLRATLGSSSVAVMLSEVAVAAIVFLTPTIFMGGIFGLLAQQAENTRGSVSSVVALNSFGAALGPLIFGVAMYPFLGSKWTVCGISLGYVMLAGKSWIAVAVAAVILIVAFSTPSRIAPLQLRQGQQIAAYREGFMASVAVLQETNSQRVLKVNNRFQMGGTAARIAEQRHADIPLLLHGSARRALFLGLGTGITFSTCRFYPEINADGVELLPEVVEVMPMFAEATEPQNNSALLKAHVADARRFVQNSGDQYEVIVADLFHPAQDGAGLLYTKEHFQAIRNRLAKNGLFCQWLPLYQLDESVLKMITATFLGVFPSGEAWLLRFNVDTPVLGLVSRASGSISELLENPSPILESHLKRVGLNDSVRLWGCFFGGPEELRAFAGGAKLNTDDRPRVIFDAPKATYSFRPAYEILMRLLEQFHSNLKGVLPEGAFQTRVQKYIRARNVYLRGLAWEEQREVSEAIEAYIESAKLSPDFTTGYAQCITIAAALHTSNPEAAKALLKKLEQAQPQRTAAADMLRRLESKQ